MSKLAKATYTFVNDVKDGKLYIDLDFKRAYALRKHLTLNGQLATAAKGTVMDKAELRYLRETSWEVPSNSDLSVKHLVTGQTSVYLVVRHSANLPSAARKAHIDEFIAIMAAERGLLEDSVSSHAGVITVPDGTITP